VRSILLVLTTWRFLRPIVILFSALVPRQVSFIVFKLFFEVLVEEAIHATPFDGGGVVRDGVLQVLDSLFNSGLVAQRRLIKLVATFPKQVLSLARGSYPLGGWRRLLDRFWRIERLDISDLAPALPGRSKCLLPLSLGALSTCEVLLLFTVRIDALVLVVNVLSDVSEDQIGLGLDLAESLLPHRLVQSLLKGSSLFQLVLPLILLALPGAP